jgi:hypothetical protein
MLQITLIRGLPGSGKTHLAHLLGGPVFSADDFFVGPDGVYRFDPTHLPRAHIVCQGSTLDSLARRESPIVANTFTCRWEIQPYVKIASATGAILRVIDLFDSGLDDEALVARGVHGVPLKQMQIMRARYEHDWRASDPRPPWERSS